LLQHPQMLAEIALEREDPNLQACATNHVAQAGAAQAGRQR
jgi:hypothetical protein